MTRCKIPGNATKKSSYTPSTSRRLSIYVGSFFGLKLPTFTIPKWLEQVRRSPILAYDNNNSEHMSGARRRAQEWPQWERNPKPKQSSQLEEKRKPKDGMKNLRVVLFIKVTVSTTSFTCSHIYLFISHPMPLMTHDLCWTYKYQKLKLNFIYATLYLNNNNYHKVNLTIHYI